MSYIIRTLILITILGTFLDAASAHAQTSPYEDDYLPFSEDLGLGSLGVSLFRDPDLMPENFVVRVAPRKGSISGCPTFKNFSYETSYASKTFKIEILGISVDNSEFPYYNSCRNKVQNPVADIVVNKDDLIERGIEQLNIVNEDSSQTLEMIIDEQMVTLGPCDEECIQSGLITLFPGDKKTGTNVVKKQAVYGVKNPMKLWFYPAETMLLYVPGAKTDSAQLQKKVRGFAKHMGLTPMEDIYLDFKSPLVKSDYFYYVDESGKYSDQADNGGTLGMITLDKTAFRLNGDVPTTEKVQVFARRPGAYD